MTFTTFGRIILLDEPNGKHTERPSSRFGKEDQDGGLADRCHHGGRGIFWLTVNIISAAILHHDHKEGDHNIRAAYLHVIADALTSITAIAGLTSAMIWNILWLDALGGMLSSLVIIKWSVSLMKDSGIVLLDIRPTNKGKTI